MVTVTEALKAKPPLGSALADGVRVLSVDQTLEFNLYRRYVFPLDGLVYWIKVIGSVASIQPYPALVTQTFKPKESVQVVPGGLTGNLIIGGRIMNPLAAADQKLPVAESLFIDTTAPATHYASPTTKEVVPGESFDIFDNYLNGVWVTSLSGNHHFTVILWVQTWNGDDSIPATVEVEGSLHYASMIDQNEDATVDSNEIVFTSLVEIQPFNQLALDQLYICQYQDLRFAFSARGRLYEQADLYHYSGRALFSVNQTQIIDDPSDFNPTLVISNSLPIWLSMPGYVPPYPTFTCPIPLYPSFLSPDNLTPPFGTVHIEDTHSLQASPRLGPRMQQTQLCAEKVRVTTYGVDNETIQTFLWFVEQFSFDWGTIGMMNMPSVHDEKRTQPEFRILAQKKIIEFDINYNQHVARDMARQLIEAAKVQFYPSDSGII